MYGMYEKKKIEKIVVKRGRVNFFKKNSGPFMGSLVILA